MAQDKTSVMDEQALESTVNALADVNDTTVCKHDASPKEGLHKPADQQESHSWLAKHLPSWKYIEDMENSWHLGNWVRDRKTNEKTWEAMSIYVRLGMHLLYYGTYQEKLLSSKRAHDALYAESAKMGREYDQPESTAHIPAFIQSFGLEPTLAQLEKPDPADYKTFNEFFARGLRPDARPIDEPDNAKVTSTPADCRLTVFPTLDLATQFWVKGANFTLERLFQDADLAREFDQGAMAIARLAPQDYHRWHSPVDGTVRSTREVPGTYYTVNPQAVNEPGPLNVYCENRRSVMVVDTDNGPVVIVAVGAMLVGSIKYVNAVDMGGSRIKRGQCLGCFLYGGSTVLVIYPPGKVDFDEDLVKYSTDPAGPCETLVAVGNRIGTFK